MIELLAFIGLILGALLFTFWHPQKGNWWRFR